MTAEQFAAFLNDHAAAVLGAAMQNQPAPPAGNIRIETRFKLISRRNPNPT